MPGIGVFTDPINSGVFIDVDGFTGAESITVTRVSASGDVMPVRNADPAVTIGGLWSGWDYECPLDEPVTYRAVGVSSSVNSGQVLLDSNGSTWLKHPGRPSLNTIIRLKQFSESFKSNREVLNVIGRPNAVVLNDVRSGATGNIEFAADTAEAVELVDLMLSYGVPLLLQTPANKGIGSRYVSIGDVLKDRRTKNPADPRRDYSGPYDTVDRSHGLADGGRGNTWQTVDDTYTTWADLSATASTWVDVLEGVA